jgi:hypothetical protein
MASLLSACSKLEELAICAYDKKRPRREAGKGWGDESSLVDVDALAAGARLLSLRLPMC